MAKKPISPSIDKPKINTVSSPIITRNTNEDDVNDTVSVVPILGSNGIFDNLTKKFIPYIIIAVLGLILNYNTFNHEYALDDDIIICKNEFVLQGVKGLPEIFKYDVFESFYRSMNTVAQLAGGRYRPFSVATFAIEQEFIGTLKVPDSVLNYTNAMMNRKQIDSIKQLKYQVFLRNFFPQSWDVNGNKVQDASEDVNKDGLFNEYDYKIRGMGFRHVNNVLLYILSVCCIFLFLSSWFFKNNKLMALLISLLFLAHPIHTEVVADVKSRDEILSLLFMVLTMHQSFLYVLHKKWKHIILTGLFFLLALLSKEYGVTLLLIIPICYFVYFKKISFNNGDNTNTTIMVCLAIAAVYGFLYFNFNGVKEANPGTFGGILSPYIPWILFGSIAVWSAVYYKFIKLKGLLAIAPVLLIAVSIYMTMRNTVVISGGDNSMQNSELLNNPYLFAEGDQMRATQMFTNLKYFVMLIVPTKLSCDYSYNVIPFRNYSDPMVLLAMLIVFSSIFFLIRAIVKRKWIAFPISFALLHLFLVNNLFFNIGATMGERLVYHTSLGTCILMVWGLNEIFKRLKIANVNAYALAVLPFIIYYSYKTIQRNPAWKNDIALHLTDVKTYPESTMLNGNACTRLIELSEKPINKPSMVKLLDSAKIYGYKSLKLHERFVNSYLNMGIISAKLNNTDSAAYFWNKVREYYPSHPQLPAIDQSLTQNIYNKALEYANKEKNLPKAIEELEKAYKLTPRNPRLLYDLGGMCFNTGNVAKAKKYWTEGLQYNPTDTMLMRGVAALRAQGY